MKTVLSYIIQKRYSQEYENIATDVLAFILESNESARRGLMKLLRGIVADLPDLHFKTQESEDNTRPDMWGLHENDPRVFIENKFWAGLTDNQPVEYLNKLAGYTQPTILLMVGPETRMGTLRRELDHRLRDAGISVTNREASAGIVYSITTGLGPILALTSWSRLLSTLELEVADDQSARSDLLQLRSLCDAADDLELAPISAAQLTDQRTPGFIFQLGSILRAVVDFSVNENILNIKGTQAVGSWESFGRYARFSSKQGVGIWLGTHFRLWKEHGRTPLWLIFYEDENGQFNPAHKVRVLLEPWAAREGIFTTWDDYGYIMEIDIETGEEKDTVVRAIVDRLKKIAEVLSTLDSKP